MAGARTCVRCLAALVVAGSFAGAARADGGKGGRKPAALFGVPACLGIPAKDLAGIVEAREKYVIYLLRDGEGVFSVEPVMVRFVRKYQSYLRDRHAEAVKLWNEGAAAWRKDPANRGKPYDAPVPRPTVIARQFGPFGLDDAKKALATVQEMALKLNEEAGKRKAKAAPGA